MRTLADLKYAFLVRNGMDTTAAYYTDTILNKMADDAHQWAAGLYKWPVTEGRVSTTMASLYTDEDGYLVGVYPEGWKPDTIRQLRIGGKKADKKNFAQFQDFLENNPQSNKRIFSDFGLRYYVNPNIDLSGTVTVWGQYAPASLGGDDTAVTVFSDFNQDANEAIVEKMLEFGMQKEKKTPEAKIFETASLNRLAAIWKHITDEQFAYQTTEGEGMFKRINVERGAIRDDLFKRDQFY